MATKLFYNPKCSKCREAKDLLEGESCEFEIIEYLKEIPNAKELKEILKMLKMKAVDLIRKSEPIFKTEYADKNFSNHEWIKVMVKHPILIERPILIHDNKAIIGRPPSKIIELI